jgi:hypothetical protein
MTQNEKVLRELTEITGAITPKTAFREYGIMRLAARIAELRAKGHNIVTEMVTNGGVRYARYRLVK